MKYIDLTFPSPAGNLACDEALLDLCEAGKEGELLRFWEASTPFVVLGYANHAASEVHLDACKEHGISIFRRCSGGGTVLQGPGCLNYSLILPIQAAGHSRSISETNRFIMERHRAALARMRKEPVHIEGHTDLALGGRKFSGNAQRRKRRALIFHGTFLLHFNLEQIETFLRPPSKHPEYRRSRPHTAFLTNLGLDPATVKSALRQAWQADEATSDLPLANFSELVHKYSSDGWNFRF